MRTYHRTKSLRKGKIANILTGDQTDLGILIDSINDLAIEVNKQLSSDSRTPLFEALVGELAIQCLILRAARNNQMNFTNKSGASLSADQIVELLGLTVVERLGKLTFFLDNPKVNVVCPKSDMRELNKSIAALKEQNETKSNKFRFSIIELLVWGSIAAIVLMILCGVTHDLYSNNV